MIYPSYDTSLNKVFQPYLRRGEQLIWAGKPQVYLHPADKLLLPLASIGLMLAAIWESYAVARHFPVIYKMGGLLVCGVLLLLIYVRVGYKMMRNGSTTYALTNERVLFLYDDFDKHLEQIPMNRIPGTKVERHSRQYGSIIFCPLTRNGVPAPEKAFHDIVDVQRVNQLIDTLRMSQAQYLENFQPEFIEYTR